MSNINLTTEQRVGIHNYFNKELIESVNQLRLVMGIDRIAGLLSSLLCFASQSPQMDDADSKQSLIDQAVDGFTLIEHLEVVYNTYRNMQEYTPEEVESK